MNKKLLYVTMLFLLVFTVQAAWEDIDSTEYYDSCGDDGSHLATDMLDGSGQWWHIVKETHTLTLDLGSSKTVSKIRTKSAGTGSCTPVTIIVYVSDTVGTWGTAVDTINIAGTSASDWTENVLATAKEGRYIHLEMTTSTEFMGWGSVTTKVLDFFTGAVPKRWTSVIDLTAQYYSTSSASYVPTDAALSQFPWDGSKYSNIVAAYFEVNGILTGGGGEGDLWAAKLYDRNNSADISVVSSPGTNIIRSNDISASLPAGEAVLDVRIVNVGGTSVAINSAKLIIVQESDDAGDKTRVYIPVGQKFGLFGTTYKKGSGAMLSDSEHQYKYIEDNFNTTSAAYFYANIVTATAGNTAYAKMDNIGGTDAIGEVSTTATVPTLLQSSDVSGSLTNDSLYTAYIKNAGARVTTTMYNGWFVLDVDPVTKFEHVYDLATYGKRESSNTGWQTSTNYRFIYNTGDMWNLGLDSETVKHSAVLGHTGGSIISGAIYDDGVRNSTSDVNISSTGANYLESDTLTISDDSTILASWNVGTLGLFQSGILWNNNLIVTIDIGEEAEEEEGVCDPPAVGDWHVTEPCTIENEEVNMTGRNLYVYDNGSLTIVNSNFTYSNESIAGNLSVDPLSTRIRI